MTKITDRQRQIIKFIRDHENDSVKLNDIVKKFKHWYYHNGRKHVSDIIYRMVKSKKLIKPKHGYYQLNDSPNKTTGASIEFNPNQINLF